MGIRSFLKGPGRLFYGWRIVGLGAIANAVGGGIYQYGFAIFFLPITKDLNLSRAATSLVFSLSRAEGAVEGPLAGWLVDKFGPRHILFGGALLTGLGYLLLAQINSFGAFLLVYVGVISLGFNGGFAHTVITAVNSWFVRRRGFAMSVTLSAFSLGGGILAPFLSFLVQRFGWRTASVVGGLAIWALVMPASLGLKRSPESIGLAPDGDPLPTLEHPARHPANLDFTVGQALRNSSYWWLAFATTLRLAVVNVISVHFVPLMVWKGTSEPTAALLLSAMAFLSIPARIGLGWVGDRAPKYYIIAIGMFMGVASFVLLQFAQGMWQLWAFVILFAIVEGVNPLNWALVGDFFGRTSFATLRGVMGLVYTLGTVVAPVATGLLYDETRSYALVLWALAAIYGLGAAAFALLRAPQQTLRTPALETTGKVAALEGESRYHD